MSFPAIRTFDQLTKTLISGVGYGGIPEVLEAFKPSEELLLKKSCWNQRHYCRTPIARFPSIEVLLICWEAGQQTPIHNYNGQKGWIKVLKGELLEETFYKEKDLLNTDQPLRYKIHKNDTTFLDDGLGFHRFSNISDSRTISIHIYAERIRHWTVYDVESGTFKSMQLDQDVVSDNSIAP